MKHDIVLVMPPPWTVEAPPLAPYLLKTILDFAGYNAVVFDLNLELFRRIDKHFRGIWDLGASGHWYRPELFDALFANQALKKVIEDLFAIDTESFGFSLNSSNVVFTTWLVEEMRRRGMNVPIVAGGPGVMPNERIAAERFPLLLNDFGVDDPYLGTEAALERTYRLFDALVLGEGENTIIPLIERIKGQKEGRIDGAFFSNDLGKQPFRERALIDDLDCLPFPRYDDYPFDRHGGKPPFIHLLGSRGCVRRCKFCTENRIWGRHRSRSAGDITDEVAYHVEHNRIDHFGFVDLVVNAKPNELARFCDNLLERGIRANFYANMIVDKRMDQAYFSRLNQAGFKSVMVGIESGSNKVLREMKKGFCAETAATFLEQAKAAGLATVTNFIVGYPSETDSDFQQTMAFLRKNGKQIDRVGVIDACIIYRRSELYEKRAEYGIDLAQVSSKAGTLEYWTNELVGDYTDRFARVIEFVAELSRQGIAYAERTAGLTGDIDSVLGFSKIALKEREAMGAAVKSFIADMGIDLSLLKVPDYYYALLKLMIAEGIYEREVGFNHLLLNYSPERAEFYEILFAEWLFPLDFGQVASREIFWYAIRKHGRTFLAHLVHLSTCSDPYLRYIACKCLIADDFGYCLNEFYEAMLDEQYDNYPDEVRYGLSSEKEKFDRWHDGDIVGFYKLDLLDQQEKTTIVDKIRSRFSSSPLVTSLDDSDCLYIDCYLLGKPVEREVCLIEALNRETNLALALFVFYLEECGLGVGPLHQRTLTVLSSLWSRLGRADRLLLGRYLDLFHRLLVVEAETREKPGIRSFARRIEVLGKNPLSKSSIKLDPGLVERLGTEKNDDDERIVLALLLKGDAWERNQAFLWMIGKFSPELSSLYSDIFQDKFGQIKVLDKTWQRILLLSSRFPEDSRELFESLLGVADPYARFIAMLALLRIDFRFAITHFIDFFSDANFRSLPGRIACIVFPYKACFDAWARGDLDEFLFLTEPKIDRPDEKEPTWPGDVARPVDICRNEEDVRILYHYLFANRITCECAFRRLLQRRAGQSDRLLHNIVLESLRPLPPLSGPTLDLIRYIAHAKEKWFEPYLMILSRCGNYSVRATARGLIYERANAENDIPGASAIERSVIFRSAVQQTFDRGLRRQLTEIVLKIQADGLTAVAGISDTPPIAITPGAGLLSNSSIQSASTMVYAAFIANEKFVLYQTIRSTSAFIGGKLKIKKVNLLPSRTIDRIELVQIGFRREERLWRIDKVTRSKISIDRRPTAGGGFLFCPATMTISAIVPAKVETALIGEPIFNFGGKQNRGYGAPCELSFELAIPQTPSPLVRIQIFAADDLNRECLLFGMNNRRATLDLPCDSVAIVRLDIAELNLRAGQYRLVVEMRSDESATAAFLGRARELLFEIPPHCEDRFIYPGFCGADDST